MFSLSVFLVLVGLISSFISIYEFIKSRTRGARQLALVFGGVAVTLLAASVIFAGVFSPQAPGFSTKSVPTSATSHNPTTSATNPTPSPTPTIVPAPTLDAVHGLNIASAANIIIHFYDEKGLWKGQRLIKDITNMTLPTPIDSQMESCVDAAYEYSFLYSPETVQGMGEDAFTLQFSGSRWAVASMDGCTWDSSTKTTPSPQTPSAAPPTSSQAVPLIKPYFDNSPYWKTGYVLYAVQGLTFRQQVGDHIGACVSYTYAYWSDPSTPVGPDQRKFGFEYTNGAWRIDSVDNSFSMGHSSC